MKKYNYTWIVMLAVLAACQDLPQNPDLEEQGVEFRVNGRKVFIEQEGQVNYGKVSGSTHISAETFEGEGMLFNLGSGFSAGTHFIQSSAIELVYRDINAKSYTFVSGKLQVSEYQETLLKMKGNFEGVAVNDNNQQDTVEILEGKINLDFN